MLTKNQRDIKDFIKKRRIVALAHFTQLENLDSILRNGLLSKEALAQKQISYNYNDELRLEGKNDAICLSISFPNYKMFYKYRCSKKGEWCVLELDPSILYEKECLFCISNAASSGELRRSDAEKMNISGLKKLFYDPTFHRDSVNLHTRYTTNPQAEVLVLDSIEPKYINGIHFDRNHSKYKEFTLNYPKFKFCISPRAFGPRCDYESW